MTKFLVYSNDHDNEIYITTQKNDENFQNKMKFSFNEGVGYYLDEKGNRFYREEIEDFFISIEVEHSISVF